jgi:hypothetical protein
VFAKAKDEQREVFNLRHKYESELDQLKFKLDEVTEENDYFKQKIDRVELQNKDLQAKV